MAPNVDQVVVVLHPNIQAVSTPLAEVLLRFNEYGQSLQDLRPERKPELILLVGCSKSSSGEVSRYRLQHLRVIRLSKSRLLSLKYIICSTLYIRKLVRENYGVTLVAGDLRASLFPILVIKYLFSRKVRLQTSVHGNLTFNVKCGDLKNYCVMKVVVLALRSSDSIRVVSRHLKEIVSSRMPGSNSKIVISPIPISKLVMNGEIFRKENNTIALVGRLHSERGIIQALEYAEKILISDPSVRLFIIGDGPLRANVESWLSRSKVNNQVKYFGKLSNNDVIKLYSEIDILISNADTEGYGLAVREAALSGCRVLMRRNDGSAELSNVFGGQIFEYGSFEEFWGKFGEARILSVPARQILELRGVHEKLDGEYRKLLIKSWLPN